MNIDYDSLFKGVSTELKPLYLIYGQEQYLVDTVVNKIKKTFGEMLLGINYIMIDESNVDNIISDIEMPAFGYDKKLIIVNNSGLFNTAEAYCISNSTELTNSGIGKPVLLIGDILAIK